MRPDYAPTPRPEGYFGPPHPLAMSYFEQTHLTGVLQLLVGTHPTGKTMAVSKRDKRKEYSRYAVHCLNLVTEIKSQDDRTINREMAAEWLQLADSSVHPLKPKK
jgi:hypothetical protein